MRPLFLSSIILLCSCAAVRDPAPDDLDGLLRYLFRNWEDPALLSHGMSNLATWLDDEEHREQAHEGYQIAVPEEADVHDVTRPDRDLDLMLGAVVAGVSVHPIDAHATLLPLEDQIWNDPTAHNEYHRVVTEGDADTFVDHDSDLIRTVNDIDKKGAFGVNVPYVLFKDYRWTDAGDSRRAIVGRSWNEEGGCSANGKNCLNQSFSIDLFYEREDGETIRLTATWAELTTQVDDALSDDLRIAMMVSGVHDIYEYTDMFIDEEL